MEGFIFGEMPEEMKQMMHAQQEQREMVITYKQAAFKNLIDSLDAEQTAVMRMIFEDCTTNEGLIHYIIGYLSNQLQSVHNACQHCGGQHDNPLEHMMPSGEDKPLGPDSDEGRQAMQEYNLDDVRMEENPDVIIGYICKNCQQRYVSIEDRMLRKPGPEGCGGCQQKAKWG